MSALRMDDSAASWSSMLTVLAPLEATSKWMLPSAGVPWELAAAPLLACALGGALTDELSEELSAATASLRSELTWSDRLLTSAAKVRSAATMAVALPPLPKSVFAVSSS